MATTTPTRTIDIHYELCQINLGDDATAADVDGWLDNLAALIAEEFGADVILLSGGTWCGRSTCSHDADVDARLHEISAGDEWIALLPVGAVAS